MSRYITGQGSKAFAGFENGYTTPETTPSYSLLAMTGESMTATYNKLQEDTLIGTKTLPDQDLGSVETSGGISSILKPAFVDWFMKGTLGLFDTTASGTTTSEGITTVTNVYKLAAVDADLPTSEMYLARGTQHFKYDGLTISSATLNCTAQDFVKVDINFNGHKETYISSTADWNTAQGRIDGTYADLSSYKCTKAKLFHADAGSDSIGAFTDFGENWDACPTGTVYDVESATVTFDNGLENTPATYCSGIYANQPVHGQRSVTIQCNVPYSGYETNGFEKFRQDYYANENADKLALMLVFCSKDMVDTEPQEQVFVVFPNISITEMSANVSGQGLIDGSFTGTALSVGSKEPVIVTVRHLSE